MIQQACVESYGRLKNLKLVGEELGVRWQAVYSHLRAAGVPVTGDKARYGCAKDRFASHAERLFSQDVPLATDSNQQQFQAAIDFYVNGHSVDVKASKLHPSRQESNGKTTSERWMFCINKQKDEADFFVLYAFGHGDALDVLHVFLIPREIATASTTISIPTSLRSKWADYRVDRGELASFFQYLQPN